MAIKINQQSWSPFLITRLCHQNLRNNSVESPNSVSHVYHPPCWVISAPHNRNSFMFHTGINLSPNPKIGIFLPECSHTCPSKSCHIHSPFFISLLRVHTIKDMSYKLIWTLPGRFQTLLSKLPNLHPCLLGQQASKQLFLFPYCIWFLLPLLGLKPLFFVRIEACICYMTICCII